MRGMMTGSVRGAVMAFLVAVSMAGCGDSAEQAAVGMVQALDDGKVTGTRGTMQTIATGLQAYAIDRSGYPKTESLDEMMSELVPAHLRGPVKMDAWGRSFSYHGSDDTYTLISAGTDGSIGTGDDIVLVDGRFTESPRRGGF